MNQGMAVDEQKENDLFVLDRLMDPLRESDSRDGLRILFGRVPHFDLACVGTSLCGMGAMTFEAVAHLYCADVVFCYPLSRAQLELMMLLNKNVINMNETLYAKGNDFDKSYAAIIEHVMTWLRDGKRVAYATQGSCAFNCYTAVSLHRKAKQEGFSSTIAGGVSSLELLTAELWTDYDIGNIQCYNANAVFSGRIELNPKVPCLIFNFGRFLLPAVGESINRIDNNRLADFAELLRGVYSPDHEIVLIFVKFQGSCLKVKTTLRDLERTYKDLPVIPTVFLPGCSAC